MSFEDCLKERDKLTILAKIENPHMKYLNFTGVATQGEGSVSLHYNNSHYMTLTLPECSLQKELDKVINVLCYLY